MAQLERIFATALAHDLIVHIHTSPGAASDIDQIGKLVDRFGDETKIHLVHFGGGMSGHIKLAGGRFFDWISAGKRVYTDLSWAIGFAPRWLAAEVDRRGIGYDRLLFASDEPWGDHAGEYARLAAATGDGELSHHVFTANFAALYD
jgi:predicted TIM-barrel fold metal-dependent hydrolase